MAKKEPKWKRFEKLAAEIQKELAPTAQVEHDVKLKGEDSGTARQIDIVVRQTIGQYPVLIVLQCKDEKAPLDVNAIGEFSSAVRDVRANKGALVSSSGFTEAAVTLAKHNGIDVFRLVDVENKDWKIYASLPAAMVSEKLLAYSLKLANNPDILSVPFRIPLSLIENLAVMPLYRSDGSLVGEVQNLITKAWADKKIPREGGEHVDVTFLDEPTFIKDGDDLVPLVATANIIVEKKIYFGNIPIQSMRGFHNVSTGGVHTRKFLTEMISIDKVEKEWQVVESLEQLSVKPVIIMYMSN